MKPSIFKSRKFWIMVSDTVVSLVVFFGGLYLTEATMAQVVQLIAILQVPVAFLIAAIAYEDGAFMAKQ